MKNVSECCEVGLCSECESTIGKFFKCECDCHDLEYAYHQRERERVRLEKPEAVARRHTIATMIAAMWITESSTDFQVVDLKKLYDRSTYILDFVDKREREK